MPNVVTDSNPITLADFEGLTSDKPVRQLIHTIRDYNGFFDLSSSVAMTASVTEARS